MWLAVYGTRAQLAGSTVQRLVADIRSRDDERERLLGRVRELAPTDR